MKDQEGLLVGDFVFKPCHQFGFFFFGLLLVSGTSVAESPEKKALENNSAKEKQKTPLPPGAIARFAEVNLPSHLVRPMRVAFLPDGKTVATWGSTWGPDRQLVFWNAVTGKRIRFRNGHYQVAFAPNGKIMAIRDGDKEKVIRILEVESGKEIGRVQVAGNDNYPMVVFFFSPDGKFLAVSGGTQNNRPNDPPLWLWNVVTSKKVRSFPVRQTLGYLDFSSDNKYLATSKYIGNENSIQVWDVVKGKLVQSFKKNTTAISFSPQSNLLVAVGDNGPAVRCWDILNWQERWRIRNLENGAFSLAFSPNAQILALGTGNSKGNQGSVYLLEACTGRERWRFQGHKETVFSLSFSPDGLLLASARETVLVWDVTGKILAQGNPRLPLKANVLKAHWATLAGKDAGRAWQAICALVAHPGQAVPFLKEHLPPIRKLDPKMLASLSADLDSEDFTTRERATKELRKLGPGVAPWLRKLLESRPSSELKLRVKLLLEEGEEMRCGRAVEVLEYIASPKARGILEDLGKGEPGCSLTEDAKAALNRLNKRKF